MGGYILRIFCYYKKLSSGLGGIRSLGLKKVGLILTSSSRLTPFQYPLYKIKKLYEPLAPHRNLTTSFHFRSQKHINQPPLTLTLYRYQTTYNRTPTNDTIDYQDMGFENDPSIFVITNRFTITYGQEGYLTKNNLMYDSNRTYIKFKLSSADQNISIPVCVLAFENTD